MATSTPTISGLSTATAPVDAKHYGARPAATAAANTLAIQRALDRHPWVCITAPGTYLIAQSVATTAVAGKKCALAIRQKTRLTLAPGVIVKLADAQHCYMLVDYEGQQADSPDIIVEGGTWDGNRLTQVQAAGTRTTGTDGITQIHSTTAWMSHMMWFSRADRIRVRDIRFIEGQKFCVLLSDCDDYIVEGIGFATNSDGVHVHGPSTGGTIRRLKGTCADNMVAFTISDYTTTITSIGDITRQVVDDIHGLNTFTILRLSGATGYTFNDFTISNVRGTVTVANGIDFVDDALGGGALVGVTMRDIKIRNVNLTTTAGGQTIMVTAIGMKELFVDGVNVSTGQALRFSGTTIAPEKVTLNNVAMNVTTGASRVLYSNCAIAKFHGSGWMGTLGTSFGAMIELQSGGAITSGVVSGVVIAATNTDNFVVHQQAGAGTTSLNFVNVRTTGFGTVFYTHATATIHSVNGEYSANNFLFGQIAASNITFVGHNNRVTVTTPANTTGTKRINDPGVSVNPSTAGFTPQQWDRVVNTNAALAGVLSVGPVIYNGTAWEKNGRA